MKHILESARWLRAARSLSRLLASASRWAPPALVCLLLVQSDATVAAAPNDSFSEADVRAVYLFNFAVFVHWPPESFESASSPFRYCTVGSQALRASLELALAGEKVGGRSLELIDAGDPVTWRHCHLFYLANATPAATAQLLARVRGSAVLTVGDSEAFVESGGMIALVRRGARLKTYINRDALADTGLQVSSKLLRLATLAGATHQSAAP